MKLTPRIQKAINLAAAKHDGQARKGDDLPYIVHPFSVALILMDYTENEDVIVAGILHDTIEDTDYTKEQMEDDFGARVAELVIDVTEKDKNLPWQERKDDYLKHLKISTFESKLICAADKLHNLQSMFEAFRKFGKEAEKRFNAPSDKKLWFYEECLKIFKLESQMPLELIKNIESVLDDVRSLEHPELKRKIFFVSCENDDCGFTVKFEHLNEAFFFCKGCKFGINPSSEDLMSGKKYICDKCKKEMERYDLYEEDNVCPICNDMLEVCFKFSKSEN